ncbi:primase-helicase family protein [Bradyrhizobium lablabi]|uniref:primase-helicase family protein n=1 Tax=Bradyrhizobium lablabi TaxID=722472 RepID=UPI00090B18DE|nr:primase-helicase family protein [Bradyrhizobium lablabi]SHL47317.1 hypothetical protein SAMN05444321_3012 [Bradyrhizobium lablabi]
MSNNAFDPGLAEAWAEHEAARKARHPNAALKDMLERGASLSDLRSAMNKIFAVVRYGDQILIANIVGKTINFMSDSDFHKMLANQVFGFANGKTIKLSTAWLNWPFRRQFIGRGAVFEPGGPLEISGDMLNIFRGLAIDPAPGDWSLMQSHILKVLCSGQQDIFDYFVSWMAWSVQHLDQPVGVAVALLGDQGAGKGIFVRSFGSIFGEHFAHIANGDQLTGRFNASIGKSCLVFLDEAVWAGDKKAEGVLKGLITEPSLSLEAKFRDPITVENRLRIIVASNNEWAVPAGIGDRRWLILNVDNSYAGTNHATYFDALGSEIENGGAAAMLHDLLAIDLSGFNVKKVPRTAAKAQQQALSLPSIEAWLYQVLQDGAIDLPSLNQLLGAKEEWKANGLMISKDWAYAAYEGFSKKNRDFKPAGRSQWSKRLNAILGSQLTASRITGETGRMRYFQFGPLGNCRAQLAKHVGADFEWEPDYSLPSPPDEAESATAHAKSADRDAGNTGKRPDAAPAPTAVRPSDIELLAKSCAAADDFIARQRP